MMRFLKLGGVLVILLAAAAQLVRPERTNPPSDPALRFQPAAELEKVLRRACYDCHSNETQWPWYSNLAPMSWLMADHVRHGRQRLNFSEWGRYAEDRRKVLTYEVCEAVENRSMPMASYLRAHPEARLEDADIETICGFATK